MPDWKSVPRFLEFQTEQSGGWPWGWAIYRTSYANTSDEDWARAIEKLDQACLADLEFFERRWFENGASHVEMIREGYRNVIFEDPALEGASEEVIQRRHQRWVDDHGLYVGNAVPRHTYCLLLNDRCVRSILASAEPRKPTIPHYQPIPYVIGDPERLGMVGYVNVIDCQFAPENPENEYGEYYRGLVRVHLDCLFRFALLCEDLMTGEQGWGEYGMERPIDVIYTNGHSSVHELKDMFLSSPDRDVNRTVSLTELEYIERQ
jgi:hypothetical protein